MVAVLRKNHAWLHGLMKLHLPEIVPRLHLQDIIPADAEERALCEDIDASTRATELLTVMEKEMSDRMEPCSFGLLFIKVLIDSGIGMLDNLETTAEEFREEQRRESRRSSVASVTGCLDSSSGSVFIDVPCETGTSREHGEPN